MTLDLILLIVVGAIVLFIYYKAKKSTLPMYSECIRLYTGAPGSGKSLNASKECYEAYKRQRFRHGIYKAFPEPLKFIPKKLFKGSEHPATMYSTIPFIIGYKNKQPIYANPLEKEHLLLRKRLPQKTVLFIDEAGAFMSQWDYDNPYVREQVQYFFRYFRHWIDGTLIMTEQASGRLSKCIREVIGKYYYLDSFHKVLGFLPIAKINVTPMILAEDTATRINTEVNEWSIYCWLIGKKRYDSKAYSELYEKAAERTCGAFTCKKTNYIIDLTVSDKDMKDYKNNRHKWHEWIYKDREFVTDAQKNGDQSASCELDPAV